MGRGIKLSEIAERMDLKNLTPELDLTEKEVHVPDVNRPALQLAGFFDHFDSNPRTDHRECRVHIYADADRRAESVYL